MFGRNEEEALSCKRDSSHFLPDVVISPEEEEQAITPILFEIW